MSDDEGVTPFQEAVHAFLAAVTPARGQGALGTWRSQGGSRTPSRGQADPRREDELMSKPTSSGVYARQYLSHAALGRLTKEKPRSEPDREDPPSGIVGGRAGTWTRWEPE